MPEQLKTMFFTPDSLGKLANELKLVYPGFQKDEFLLKVQDKLWTSLELKEKMRHTTHCLKVFLPADYNEAVTLLMKAAPGIKGFEAMTLPDFVEVYGLGQQDLSLKALRVFTRYSSSEFAIRPFLDKDPTNTMAFMRSCAVDQHENVRRFASEGCRPRLPWAMALPRFKKDPASVLEVLEILKSDPSEFVRRSVANNLNDISKDHPDLVVARARIWKGKSSETDWIIKHACRTLLKAGNKDALLLFGFADPKLIGLSSLKLKKDKILIGETLSFSFLLKNETSGPLKTRLEYRIDYVKKNNRFGQKVFIISESELPPGEKSISRNQSFADMSTRTHYPGKHRITVLVNGQEKATTEFLLER